MNKQDKVTSKQKDTVWYYHGTNLPAPIQRASPFLSTNQNPAKIITKEIIN